MLQTFLSVSLLTKCTFCYLKGFIRLSSKTKSLFLEFLLILKLNETGNLISNSDSLKKYKVINIIEIKSVFHLQLLWKWKLTEVNYLQIKAFFRHYYIINITKSQDKLRMYLVLNVLLSSYKFVRNVNMLRRASLITDNQSTYELILSNNQYIFRNGAYLDTLKVIHIIVVSVTVPICCGTFSVAHIQFLWIIFCAWREAAMIFGVLGYKIRILHKFVNCIVS